MDKIATVKSNLLGQNIYCKQLAQKDKIDTGKKNFCGQSMNYKNQLWSTKRLL